MVPKIRKVEKTFVCKKCFGKLIVRNIPEIDYKAMGISHDLYYNGWIKACPHCGVTYNKLGDSEKDEYSTRSVMFKVDRRVSSTVVDLNILGCTTTFSSQGHFEHKYGEKEASVLFPYISMEVDDASRNFCSLFSDILKDMNSEYWYIDRTSEFSSLYPYISIRARSYIYSYIHTKSKFEEINSDVFLELAKIMNKVRERVSEDEQKKLDEVSRKLIFIDIDKM